MQLTRQFTTNTTLKCNTTNKILIQLIQCNVVTSNHQINSTDITKAVIMIIQLKHSPQLSSKLELNLQTTVWGWVVGPWSVITGPVWLAISCSLRFRIFLWLSMHTSEIITQPPRRRYLSIGLTTADLEPELILMRVWKNNNNDKTTLSPSFSAKSFGIRP